MNMMKPPNILIYCGKVDSQRKFQSIRETVGACVSPDCYTVYHLQHDQVRTTPWKDNLRLLIVTAELDGFEDVFLDYLNSGGCVLSFGSSLDTKFLQKKEVQSHTGLATFSMVDKKEDVKYLRGRYNYEEIGSPGLDLTVMARDQCHGEPVIVGIDNQSESSTQRAKAVFSQLYLHNDPTDYSTDQVTFDQLKCSNTARIEILKYILSWLGVDCNQISTPSLTAAVLLTKSKDLRDSFLSSTKKRLDAGCLKCPSQTLEFIENDYNVDDLSVTPAHLPVICRGDLQLRYFRQEEYWTNLNTYSFGQVVLYTDVTTSTMTIFEGEKFSVNENTGLIAIAGRQTSGKGRGGNTWLSPLGCGMFTLLVQIPVSSQLGQRMTFFQHIVPLAVVNSVTSMSGYEMLDLKIKWPNDIYYSDQMKLGGVMVISTVKGPTIHAVIGCGFNVDNSNPTICINDIITQYNRQHGTSLPLCSTEQLIARTLTHLEMLITDFEKDGYEQFCQKYYKVWLHSGKQVKLETEGEQDVTITGLDEDGFLKVETNEGNSLSVKPDGNTFDIVHNLIRKKTM